MRKALLVAAIALLVTGGACSDEKEPTGAAAGAPPAADAGGQASAGAPTEPGASGAAGAIDAGGAPAAGAAGSPPEPEQWLFGTECPQPVDGDHPLYTSCTFEGTCEALGCGDGFSRWDAEGCDRRCDSNEHCADGQRCRFTVLSGDNCVVGSHPDGCKLRPDGSCGCSWTEDCIYPRVCVDAEAYPASDDCPVADATCAELAALHEALYDGDRGDRSEAELDAVAACKLALTERRQELACD